MSATTTQRPNVIEEITIGTQTWSLRNYDFGGIAYDDDIDNVPEYGKLYTWAEANAIDIDGWHLPTETEYTTLSTYLGGTTVAGGHLKETGLDHWSTPNTGADNSSGFTALGGGQKQLGQPCVLLNESGIFWTATEHDGANGRTFYVTSGSAASGSNAIAKTHAFSVRLIKD